MAKRISEDYKKSTYDLPISVHNWIKSNAKKMGCPSGWFLSELLKQIMSEKTVQISLKMDHKK